MDGKLRFGGVERDQIVGMLLVRLAQQLQLLVEIQPGRVHGLSQLFDLLGQLVEPCHCVLGRFGVCGAAPRRAEGHEADDRPGHRFFRHKCGGKPQDCASFDCRRRLLRRTACAVGLGKVTERASGVVQRKD